MERSLPPSPPIAIRLLGMAGVLGGVVLLAAFVVAIDADLNWLRLVLFNAGAIAIIVAAHRYQASVAPTLSLLVAAPAVLSNAWYLIMVVLAISNPHPFAGFNGLVFFWAGAAMWFTDAAFGLVTLRIGAVARWGPLALAIGSVLAITGMDRLELTTRDSPTLFLPISLIGIALNGAGWILLGLEFVTQGRRIRITG